MVADSNHGAPLRRRDFVGLVAMSAGSAVLTSCNSTERPTNAVGRRMLVLAFDGMDPKIVAHLMRQRRLPNLARLAESGSFTRLRTSTPPHTPVAFSSLISGADPGLHHVFDFIHRDPQPPDGQVIRPFFSTADAVAPEAQWAIPLGDWKLPLNGGETQLLRRGTAFWDHLIAAGVDTDIFYLPANYPCEEPSGPGRFRCVSGMGTPDLLGGYGEFTLFTPDAPRRGRQVGGGRFTYLSMIGNRGEAELIGPPNFLRQPESSGQVEPLTVKLRFVRDPDSRVAMIEFGRQRLLLNEGEWSDWTPIEFHTGIPGATLLDVTGAPTSLRGMLRMYLKSVYPKFELYVSPVNIDPLHPINQISVPQSFASELARRHGRFHTLGIPEDTKALSHAALGEHQFLHQADVTTQERVDQYRGALADFRRGCLFFYFGATDLVQHMFWRDQDPQHPGRQPEQAGQFADTINDLYVQMDELVGDALDCLTDDDTLLVLSDHGFNSFRRGFNLNSWLVDNGFMKLQPGVSHSDDEMFAHTDWRSTEAYGLGMNGLYLNLVGREKHGQVKANVRRSVLEQVRDRLMEARDEDGTAIVHRIDLVEDLYPAADPTLAPDMIIGYDEGYRASWSTVLGGVPASLVEDNLDRWSGTHLISAERVPGMLFSSRKLATDQPSITDVAPTILAAFGVSRPAQMTGRSFIDFAKPLT